MTRTFNEKIRCPQCGYDHTIETDFERWMRHNPELKSESGIVRFDLDILLHRYKFSEDRKGTRDVQCMMFVEVKTFMATPSPAQIDTLSILNQVLRNRRPNIHSTPRRQVIGQLTKAYSKLNRRDVRLWLFGGHLLQIDGSSPDNSSRMLWDNLDINKSHLLELLRFERNPDNVELKMDIRRRSGPYGKQHRLFR